MGTTVTHRRKGQSVTDFFIEHGVLRWSDTPGSTHSYRVLKGALVNLSEHYSAIERTEIASGKIEVFASIIKVKMFKEDADGYNFAYKGIGNYDSYYTNCPESILDLLSPPTDDDDRLWREACRAKAEQNRAMKLSSGTRFYTKTPIKFASGMESDEFVVEQVRGNRIVCQTKDRTRCRISRDYLLSRFTDGGMSFQAFKSNVNSNK